MVAGGVCVPEMLCVSGAWLIEIGIKLFSSMMLESSSAGRGRGELSEASVSSWTESSGRVIDSGSGRSIIAVLCTSDVAGLGVDVMGRGGGGRCAP